MSQINIVKRDGQKATFESSKIRKSIESAFASMGEELTQEKFDEIYSGLNITDGITVEEIQDQVSRALMVHGYYDIARNYIIYREKHNAIRKFAESKIAFIERYKGSSNTANATIDDNSNVSGKNIGILNAEGHKEDNVAVNRTMVMNKLRELYPEMDAKQYLRDLESHIIYKNDESSFMGAISPYCVAATMYPFLTDGIKGIGGLSAAPKNIDSFCGMYINFIFAVSSMFAGAVATPEFLLYFDYFARKEWGDDYYLKVDDPTTSEACKRQKTIKKQIHQYWQQVIYSINQPAAARGMQSAFVNFSYFDKPFFDGMFESFRFPDGTSPQWESLKWLQMEFMQWFNQERLRCLLVFPVESFCLVYKDGKFLDQEMADFAADEYARGHSFFTYISDSVDSLSSCCRLRNQLTTREFNFTNGNIGVQTGSKSVISLNLSRIMQNWALEHYNEEGVKKGSKLASNPFWRKCWRESFKEYLSSILERVYKYHNAYNELLWDMHNANLLPVYKAGFIHLNRQYLTIGLNGLNQAAEYCSLDCSNNEEYADFCHMVFDIVKEQNKLHKTTKMMFNTELVPAESLAVKNYNWDKADGYWIPNDTNLYASYIFKPNDNRISILDKLAMHGNDFIGEYLDGGSAAHLNLSNHLTASQYCMLLHRAAEVGCQYFTFNISNSECQDCGYITKVPISKCPHCGSTKIDHYDRIIGYLTKIKNWSEGRQIEQKTRHYETIDKL